MQAFARQFHDSIGYAPILNPYNKIVLFLLYAKRNDIDVQEVARNWGAGEDLVQTMKRAFSKPLDAPPSI